MKPGDRSLAGERLYSEEDVRDVFARATDVDATGGGEARPRAGLTRAEIHEIGREVGLDEDRVSAALAAVDARRGVVPPRTVLGVSSEMARVVDLPDTIGHEEWALLVSDFREVFGTEGRLHSRDGIRSWTEGSGVRATLEPDGEGHRLRLVAQERGALLLNAAGSAGVMAGIGLLVADVIAELLGGSLFEGGVFTGPGLLIPLVLVLVGLGAVATARTAHRAWVADRQGQMEYVTRRVEARLLREPSDDATA